MVDVGMDVKFWGVRGSIPSPGVYTARYGGNTACIELRIRDSHRIIIIDAGSGIRDLGTHLVHARRQGPIQADLFLTHTHIDHIVGFPFFAPLYLPGTKMHVYGPATYEGESLESIIGSQMSYHYFSVRLAELSAELVYDELREGHFELGDGIKVTTRYLNHPLLCLGYRFEHRGRVFCTAFDTEPFRNLFAQAPGMAAEDTAVINEGQNIAIRENSRMEEFFAGADLLVYDAQYTLAEYESSRVGWGHTAVEYAIEAARRARVKRLALFHHDPARTDAEIDALATVYCRGDEGGMEICFAREGTQFEI
jgi:phosphoribosyl 1,2-cyclic phosphodiesterase